MTNREIAEAAFAAMAAGDLEGLLALVDPEVEFRSLMAEIEGGDFRGHEGVRRWWEQVVGSLGGVAFELEDSWDIGDCLVLRIRVSGHPGGVLVGQTMWQVAEVRDGKVCWWTTLRTEQEALAAARARAR